MTKNKQPIYKAVAIFLAWNAWLIPLGLHRIMMRRRYAWLHPVAFLSATLASNQFFFHTPENAELVRIFAEQGQGQGIAPHFGQFAHIWLLSFTAAWAVLVIYDAIMIFSWSVNNPYKLVEETQPTGGAGSARGYSKPREQHDQAAH